MKVYCLFLHRVRNEKVLSIMPNGSILLNKHRRSANHNRVIFVLAQVRDPWLFYFARSGRFAGPFCVSTSHRHRGFLTLLSEYQPIFQLVKLRSAPPSVNIKGVNCKISSISNYLRYYSICRNERTKSFILWYFSFLMAIAFHLAQLWQFLFRFRKNTNRSVIEQDAYIASYRVT